MKIRENSQDFSMHTIERRKDLINDKNEHGTLC
jgi:hypothetical protein